MLNVSKKGTVGSCKNKRAKEFKFPAPKKKRAGSGLSKELSGNISKEDAYGLNFKNSLMMKKKSTSQRSMKRSKKTENKLFITMKAKKKRDDSKSRGSNYRKLGPSKRHGKNYDSSVSSRGSMGSVS